MGGEPVATSISMSMLVCVGMHVAVRMVVMVVVGGHRGRMVLHMGTLYLVSLSHR